MTKETRFRKAASQEQLDMFEHRGPDWLHVFLWAIVIAAVTLGVAYIFMPKEAKAEMKLISRAYVCKDVETMKGFLDVLGEMGKNTPRPPNVENCGTISANAQFQAMFNGLPVDQNDAESYENQYLKANIISLDILGDPTKRFYSWKDLEWKDQGKGA